MRLSGMWKLSAQHIRDSRRWCHKIVALVSRHSGDYGSTLCKISSLSAISSVPRYYFYPLRIKGHYFYNMIDSIDDSGIQYSNIQIFKYLTPTSISHPQMTTSLSVCDRNLWWLIIVPEWSKCQLQMFPNLDPHLYIFGGRCGCSAGFISRIPQMLLRDFTSTSTPAKIHFITYMKESEMAAFHSNAA